MDTIPRLRRSALAGRPPDDQRQIEVLFADAWESGCISEERIQTGCVYEVQPASTYSSLCVLRLDPRLSGRRQIPFHEWWPELAPTAPLVKGYRTLDTHGQRPSVGQRLRRITSPNSMPFRRGSW